MKRSDRDSIFNSMLSLCDILCKSSNILCEVIDGIEDRDNIVKRISAYEDEGDNVYHDLRFFFGSNSLADDVDAVRLYDICTAIEEVIDYVDNLARDLYRYDITSIKDGAVSSFINVERASTHVMQLVRAINKDDKSKVTFKSVIELDHYKSDASKLFDANMNKLFSTEKDTLEIIKWRAIYTSMLHVYERFEDVAEACGKYIYEWE